MNQFQDNAFNDDIDFSAKLDFKLKSPIQFWLKGIYDQKEDLYFNVIGLAYLLNTKKWNVSIYSEKTFFEQEYDKDKLLESRKNFYFNTGFIFYFKNDTPIYLKYSNIYRKIDQNKFDKVDRLMFGSYFTLDKLLFSLGLDFNLRDFLYQDFNNTELSFTIGYKIL